MKKFTQLTVEQRYQISALLQSESTQKEISLNFSLHALFDQRCNLEIQVSQPPQYRRIARARSAPPPRKNKPLYPVSTRYPILSRALCSRGETPPLAGLPIE